MLTLAGFLLVSDFAYGFWNCCFVRPPGDFGCILLILNDPALRWVLLVLFGLGYLVSEVLLTVMVFRCMESHLGPYNYARAALIAWPIFGLGSAIPWLLDDWNQTIENIGWWPQLVGAGLSLAIPGCG